MAMELMLEVMLELMLAMGMPMHAGMSSMPTAVRGIMIPMHMPSISSMQTWS